MYNQYYTDSLMSQKEKQCKLQVESIMEIIENEFNNVKNGLKSPIDAKKDAIKTIRKLRYGDDNLGYYCISDITGLCVMHPISPELEGTNLLNKKDKDGKKFIVEILDSVDNDKGYGFTKYKYTKPDNKSLANKVTYSQRFDSWNWVISTGTYVDDTEALIQKNFDKLYVKAKKY